MSEFFICIHTCSRSVSQKVIKSLDRHASLATSISVVMPQQCLTILSMDGFFKLFMNNISITYLPTFKNFSCPRNTMPTIVYGLKSLKVWRMTLKKRYILKWSSRSMFLGIKRAHLEMFNSGNLQTNTLR